MKRYQFQIIFTIFFLLFIMYSPESLAQITEARVHDPVMIKQGNTYYVFCTGRGVSVLSSEDLVNWERMEPVFSSPPEWTTKVVKGFRGSMWAPDITLHKGKYYLYYSVSAFGRNTSAIGLATNTTLDPSDPEFKWVDQGLVVQSIPGRDLWNAIDPNLTFDDEGNGWLVFGSFWRGMKLFRLNENLTGPAVPQEWYTVAARDRDYFTDDRMAGEAMIEAPFIFRKDGKYYLFVSYDRCCQGVKSTYKIMVGRSDKITGPYLDRRGRDMVQGAATPVLTGNERWPGVGHNSVYTFDGKDYIVFHGYDVKDNGNSKLIIRMIAWDDEGWPVVSLE